MNPDAERAREEFELARAMQKRVEQELQGLAKTLDPARKAVDPEELRLMRESSDWTGTQYAAEQALFTAENGTPGIVGSHGQYQWLSRVDTDVSTLLRLCPDVVLDKYLAVTSIDSGTLKLTEQEKSEGWTASSGRVFRGLPNGTREDRDDWRVAYSPRLTSVHGLPDETHDECCAGYDEWFVFDQPAPTDDLEVFVNWCGFRLHDPGYQWSIDRFWEQMVRLAPESYIARGTVFTFATRNAELFIRVLAAFSAEDAIEE